ncbi:MAG: serine hydrolase [Kiritimatiellales bacterium]|jgi:D-alanyl-D-alanine carboxypeptidase (penicillin-binding protein 5/6)
MMFSKPCKFLLVILPILGCALCVQAATHAKTSPAKKKTAAPAAAAPAKKTANTISRDPYYSAVVIDSSTGQILQEDHASAAAYPASMVKLMNFFIIFDDVKAGKLLLDEPVTVTREVSQIGGRQVWLKEGEVFPFEELVYAMMIHSANDAAAALAIRVSGSRDAHVARMNEKARGLGLRNTVFHSVHGLPPGQGQELDKSSALDMALMAKALLAAHPEILKYTCIPTRTFRETNPVQLTSSNKLLGNLSGCDGLKTGYFYEAGFSITAAAEREGRRVIAVVMGSKDKNVRDAKAAELIEKGFARLPPPPVVETNQLPEVVVAEPVVEKQHSILLPVLIGSAALIGAVILLVRRRKKM